MPGVHLRYSNCLFTCSALLLFRVSFHDVEASSCQHVMIHKKVGDTVEFSSCLPPEGVTEATWKYGQSIIANKDKPVSETQFKDRLYLNPTNFSLTVKSLTLQDSGEFSFLSEANNQQRPTVKVTLQVHELITEQPVLKYNFTWHPSNESCTFSLECSASISNISYNWTVRNQTRSGSRLQYILREEEGDTEFTCTIYNAVSEMSTSKTVKCSNETKHPPVSSSGGSIALLIIRLVIGLVIGVLLMLTLLYFTKSKDPCRNRSGNFYLQLNNITTCFRLNQPEPVNQDEAQQQVYSSLLHGDGSVYETVRGSEAPGTGGPPNQ